MRDGLHAVKVNKNKKAKKTVNSRLAKSFARDRVASRISSGQKVSYCVYLPTSFKARIGAP